MATKFKKGDVVVLRSGGPRMTIDTIDSYDNVYAAWFSGTKHNKASFKPETLLTEDEAKTAGLVK